MPDAPNTDSPGDLSAVPLFPLPNVVLFPRAVLPLHIFEERYKLMTAHALEGDRKIAMALLRPGWEKDYYSKPEIESVICVGTILTHERLADGKYNFLLQGETRARVVREFGSEPYRLATLEPLNETHVMEIDLEMERRRMGELFAKPPWSETSLGRQFAEFVRGPMGTADLADLIAFNLLEDVALKQSLLADPDVRGRVTATLDALRQCPPVAQHAVGGRSGQGPSMN